MPRRPRMVRWPPAAATVQPGAPDGSHFAPREIAAGEEACSSFAYLAVTAWMGSRRAQVEPTSG